MMGERPATPCSDHTTARVMCAIPSSPLSSSSGKATAMACLPCAAGVSSGSASRRVRPRTVLRVEASRRALGCYPRLPQTGHTPCPRNVLHLASASPACRTVSLTSSMTLPSSGGGARSVTGWCPPPAPPITPRYYCPHLNVISHSEAKCGATSSQCRPCRRSPMAPAAASRTRHWLAPRSTSRLAMIA